MNIPALAAPAKPSSMVSEIGYDEAENRLFVRFNGGKLYAYEGVGAGEWNALNIADSAGRFINSTIKPNFQASLVEG